MTEPLTNQDMTLLIGTSAGVYRAPIDDIDEANQVLNSERVLRVRQFGDAIFVAMKSGLFRSTDRGETWANLDVPRKEVYSVLQSPDGKRLYAGTHPAHLYVSTDGGQSWNELESLQDQPSRESWHTPRHRNEAHVRSLSAHHDAGGRIMAGIEVGGVHVSEDGGETWTERRNGLHDDIHHVLIVAADEYIASTGGGLYRTRDAGRSWTRIDAELDRNYFREAFISDGRLFAAAARSSPGSWSSGADAALFESTDGGDSFESVSYPGQPEEVILAWSALNGNDDVLAGTYAGSILRRTNGKWMKIGSVPSAIHSLLIT